MKHYNQDADYNDHFTNITQNSIESINCTLEENKGLKN